MSLSSASRVTIAVLFSSVLYNTQKARFTCLALINVYVHILSVKLGTDTIHVIERTFNIVLHARTLLQPYISSTVRSSVGTELV
jgi:hypothetical protein